MNILRIIVIAIIGWFMVLGVKRGLIRQILEVVGIIIAFLASFYLAHVLAVWIEARTSADYRISLALAALAIFTGIIIFVNFVGLGLQKLLGKTVVGLFDRAAGGLFGVLKGVLLVSLVLSLVMVLPFPDSLKEDIREDPVAGVVYPVLPAMFDLVLSGIPGGASFEQIARIGESDALKKAKKKIDNIKEDFEKSKKRLEDTGKD